MREMQFEYDGKTYRRIAKSSARRAYQQGKRIVLCPSNLRPFGMWHHEIEIRNSDFTVDFDRVVAAFEHYNCFNAETGRRTNFFIETEG